MSDALSQAVSRRGVRVGTFVPCVRLPVFALDTLAAGWRKDFRATASEPSVRIRRAYAAVEQAGETARRVGRMVNPYHPVRAAQWHNAWQRGWERG